MTTKPQWNRGGRGGFVYVMAIVILAVFTTLMVAVTSGANSSVQQSHNQHLVLDARLAAESGVGFILNQIGRIQFPTDMNEENFASVLCDRLGEKLNGTGNLSGASVSYDGGTVSIPTVSLGRGTFTCHFIQTDSDSCRLEVVGRYGDVSRRVAIDLDLVIETSRVFDFGLASRGQIILDGNANIIGINMPEEASVLSTSTAHASAIEISGGVTVSGELGVSGEEGAVVISGSPSIAGETSPEEYADHIHFGVDPPEFPALDTAPLAALATNLVDSSTNFQTPGQVWNNIRIAAGTNPKFANNQILNGVIYIEAPNDVRFEGQTEINGMIVTEDNDSALSECQLHFAGGVEAYSVDRLPDTPEFEAVKDMTGTFILAPGFEVTFAGHVTAINGCIAADQMTFTGTAEGTIEGTLIGLEDLPTRIDGNVDIYIDRANANTNPVGFLKPFGLVPDSRTYRELLGE